MFDNIHPQALDDLIAATKHLFTKCNEIELDTLMASVRFSMPPMQTSMVISHTLLELRREKLCLLKVKRLQTAEIPQLLRGMLKDPRFFILPPTISAANGLGNAVNFCLQFGGRRYYRAQFDADIRFSLYPHLVELVGGASAENFVTFLDRGSYTSFAVPTYEGFKKCLPKRIRLSLSL